MEPEISEDEFRSELTEMAKQVVKEYCLEKDYTVTYDGYEADTYISLNPDDTKLLSEYPIAVEEFCDGAFGPDSDDLLRGSPRDAINSIRRRILVQELDERVRELIDGEWNAIESVRKEQTVTSEKKVFDPSKE